MNKPFALVNKLGQTPITKIKSTLIRVPMEAKELEGSMTVEQFLYEDKGDGQMDVKH